MQIKTSVVGRWLLGGALLLAVGCSSPPLTSMPAAPIKAAHGLPRVLIIGDSISQGYTPFVQQQLKGRALIIHAPGNSESTVRGLEHLDAWLGTGTWAVIHFNWGLHDMKYVDDQTKMTEVDKGKQWVPVGDYEKNLRELVQRLKKTNAKLIWCTTTPVPECVHGRVPGDEVKYNAAALRVMQAEGVPVNDLYAFVQPQRAQIGKPKDVHYTVNGYQILACKVALAIAQALGDADYSAAHPPVGVQPRRPIGYVPFHYPKTPADLWREETPALLARAHAAWDATQAVIQKGPYQANHDSIATHPCPEWFSDAKFGMFIDWGPWSVAGWAPQAEKATYPDWYENRMLKEAKGYHAQAWGADFRPDDLIQLLNAREFHPENFAKLAQAAGMKYVVPFLKHHGGYCLWDSSFTHRNSAEWGLKRDFARELSAACRAAQLHYGAYVSLGEWNYPVIHSNALWSLGFNGRITAPVTADMPYIAGKIPVNDFTREYLVPSLKELIDHTNPDMLWFDGEWESSAATWCSPEIVAYFYNRAAARGQPVCVNDRFGLRPDGTLGKLHGEWDWTRGVPGWGDFYTSEFHVIKGFEAHPWEENRSLSHSYGYNWEESSDDRYVLSEPAALDLLLGIVANGGNLLLMVSPDGSGRIPPNQERRLLYLGQWLKRNGQAIYATRPVGLNQQPAWGYLTRSKDSAHLYLIVRHWPADGRLEVPLNARPFRAVLPGAPEQALPVKSIAADGSTAQGFVVDVSGIAAPDPVASVIVVDVTGLERKSGP